MHSKMALGNSLTTIDWLAQMKSSGDSAEGKIEPSRLNRQGRPLTRRPPPSPIDLTARLDPNDAQAYRFNDTKPPYSYATLITFAINSTSTKRMTLNGIYNWISQNFPFYKDASAGWKVSMKVCGCYGCGVCVAIIPGKLCGHASLSLRARAPPLYLITYMYTSIICVFIFLPEFN